MNTERHIGAGKSAFPLTRADVERLRSNVENPVQLDLRLQNLQHIDLSYMDLQGANLRGANLQGANLRGTNLSETDLQGANLSDADLDGADLSRAHLGDTEADRVNLHRAKLSYATLRGLDLRRFDLTELDLSNADLNGTDLRDAVLRGADLQGADLSTAHLNGPELRGAILHRGVFFGDKGKQTDRGKVTRKRLPPAQPALLQEWSSPLQGHEAKQIKKALTDREAYLFGEHALLAGSDPVKLRGFFPQGFAFAQARQLFDAWLVQTGDGYNEQAIQAMWIGFAHRICELYHENESEV
ncbi:MAG TPA: pentapeptide repeat-containing protein [Ktedonobacteraceae bacterium]